MRICRYGHAVESGKKCLECKRLNYHKNKRLKHTHNREKTHCKRGHSFTIENTRLAKRCGFLIRCCRECANMHSRNNSKKQAYGITLAQKEEMFVEQGRRCAACRTAESSRGFWHTDHIHGTKIVRGILCHNCNLALGHVKDDISILIQLIKYLKRTKHGSVEYHSLGHDKLG